MKNKFYIILKLICSKKMSQCAKLVLEDEAALLDTVSCSSWL